MIRDAKKENIRPASVDLQLGEVYKISKIKLVDFEKKILPKAQKLKLPYVLKPGEYVLARTIEELKPLEKKKYFRVAGTRSRAYRLGLAVFASFFGPYYDGPVVFGIKNIGENPVKLYRGFSIVQIAFLDIHGECVPVTHDFQFGKIL